MDMDPHLNVVFVSIRKILQLFDGRKNGRCAYPDVSGTRLEPEEQARLLKLLLGVAHYQNKRSIAHAKRLVGQGSRTAAGYF